MRNYLLLIVFVSVLFACAQSARQGQPEAVATPQEKVKIKEAVKVQTQPADPIEPLEAIAQTDSVDGASKTDAEDEKQDPMLGLPPVPIPADNPQTPDKVKLGDKLFHDKRFSVDGTVSCAKCHDDAKAFTDRLQFSEGHHGLTGTRNAPTVINSAYYSSQFWDGREPDLEGQSKQPLINPVEHGLLDHRALLDIINKDADYQAAFKRVFNVSGDRVTIDHVAKAIASFERTVVAGNSPFDRFYFGRDPTAMTPEQISGFKLFVGQGRCVSCHTIEQDHALFSDSKFHNIGIGLNQVQQDVPRLAGAFLKAKSQGTDVDIAVLTDKKSSELGRFAVSEAFNDMGSFKTPTLRNIALTVPYMHDGSLITLVDVIRHYNNGGISKPGQRVNDFLSGGIRPLNLSEEQMNDLVAFLAALTSPQYDASRETDDAQTN